MTTTITIGNGEFVFSAAHSGLHDGEFERMHGHTFTVQLHLTGEPDEAGMIVDFGAVKQTLRTALAPMRKRTLIARDAPGVTIDHRNGQVVIDSAGKHYSLPSDDVLILPMANTTTESIAWYLLHQLLHDLPAAHHISEIALELAEAPDTSATVRTDL